MSPHSSYIFLVVFDYRRPFITPTTPPSLHITHYGVWLLESSSNRVRVRVRARARVRVGVRVRVRVREFDLGLELGLESST